MIRPPIVRAALLAAVVVLAFTRCRDAGAPSTPIATVVEPTPAPPLVALATGPAQVLVGAGNIASCTMTNDGATALLLDNIPGTVFTAGDNAYPGGADVDYTNCYDPTWGRHKARTRPAVGTKDYAIAGAPGYFRYFGAASGDSGKYYYSYDLGDWHVVVLNTKISLRATSAQVQWLKADLQASSKRCTVAIFNRPYYSSPSGTNTALKPIWDVLYSFGVELTVHGYNRIYERFAPQDPSGNRDDATGVRDESFP